MTFDEAVQHHVNELIEKFSAANDPKSFALIAIDVQIEAMEGFGYSGTMWDKRYKDAGYRVGTYEDASNYYHTVKQAILSL